MKLTRRIKKKKIKHKKYKNDIKKRLRLLKIVLEVIREVTMKISVIVPVYNVEKYIDKCLDNLVNQTLKDIEIIVVNDGSPDNSQDIINAYQKKYPRMIKSFIKPNGGLSDARNYGIKKAQGEYIAFLDSDDYIEIDAYEKMYKKAKEKDFDIVVCNLYYVYNDKKIKAFSNVKKDIYDKKNIKKAMIDIYPVAWNKLYKRELFKHKVFFKKGVWFEDVEFFYRIIPYIKSIGVVSEHFINYVQRQGAITKTFDNRLYHYIDNWNGIIEYYKKNKIYEEYKEELEYCYVRYLYATFIKQASNYTDKNNFYQAIDNAKKEVKEHFPHYRKNKYFYKSLKGIYLLIFNKPLAKLILKK